MQTIKTAVVVVLLLVVVYGAYIAINGAQTELPEELKRMLAEDSELEIDVSASMVGNGGSSTLKPSSGLKPVESLSTSSPLATSSSNFWNKSGDSAAPSTITVPPTEKLASPPEALTPPKLAALPTLSTPSVSNETPRAMELPTLPTPTKSDSPSLPSTMNSSTTPAPGFTGDNLKPLDPPSTPSAFSPPPSLGQPSKLVSQATAPNNLELPIPSIKADENSPIEKEPEQSVKKANLTGRSYDNAKKTALEMIDKNDFKGALATMSIFYNSPELSAEQSLDLLNLLDSLAGETIYSRRPLLEAPYIVGPGETIELIAKKYEVPAELLAKINAIDPTLGPMPGTKLKVFQGPFRAEVDVQRHEMTLFLGELYAGRFPISTGGDPQPKEGVFQVVDKQKNRNYYGKGGLQIDGSDPRNPYGGWWIDLGQDLSIHGSPEAQGSENNSLGCISLSPIDAVDVFSMLSRGSQVTIKR